MTIPRRGDEIGSDGQALTVVLADDQVAMRAGVRRILQANGVHVVAEASTSKQAIEQVLAHRPHVCLLGAGLPGGALNAAERIGEALPETKVVMLGEPDTEEDLFRLLRSGAVGYIPPAMSPERLPHTIRAIAAGEAALPRDAAARVLREFRQGGRGRHLGVAGRPDGMWVTAREFEVLRGLQRGQTTTVIAGELRISEVTVRRHVSAIMQKLGARDRREALRMLADTELP